MRFGLDPGDMTTAGTLQWIEYMAAHGAHPATIKNKISHARVHARLTGGSTQGITSYRVGLALDAVARQKDRPSKKKEPVPVEILKRALAHMSKGPEATPVRAAILLMYFATMRQSEVAPPSVARYDPTRHLACGDVVVTDTLYLNMKWAKNLQRYDQARQLTLHPTGEPAMCLVTAVREVLEQHRDPRPAAPLLTFGRTGRPITTAYLRSIWAQALRAVGSSHVLYGLHSIRKASATQAVMGGCSELEVQNHGGWKSDAYKVYIQTKDSKKVQHALKDSLL